VALRRAQPTVPSLRRRSYSHGTAVSPSDMADRVPRSDQSVRSTRTVGTVATPPGIGDLSRGGDVSLVTLRSGKCQALQGLALKIPVTAAHPGLWL
jgi:hypothetical protein